MPQAGDEMTTSFTFDESFDESFDEPFDPFEEPELTEEPLPEEPAPTKKNKKAKTKKAKTDEATDESAGVGGKEEKASDAGNQAAHGSRQERGGVDSSPAGEQQAES